MNSKTFKRERKGERPSFQPLLVPRDLSRELGSCHNISDLFFMKLGVFIDGNRWLKRKNMSSEECTGITMTKCKYVQFGRYFHRAWKNCWQNLCKGHFSIFVTLCKSYTNTSRVLVLIYRNFSSLFSIMRWWPFPIFVVVFISRVSNSCRVFMSATYKSNSDNLKHCNDNDVADKIYLKISKHRHSFNF